MTSADSNVALLVDEYRTLAQEANIDEHLREAALGRLRSKLVQSADWTPEGAEVVIQLATQHGSFLLRNALALAIALDIHDGAGGH